ncbi:hypothetical protein AA0N74_07865 [Chromobacterium vaccinii]|uniref:hypothetical protein n=1 Tax=Chromobacterium vaccinii TaxID=1108595 RepID=UPI0031E428B0
MSKRFGRNQRRRMREEIAQQRQEADKQRAGRLMAEGLCSHSQDKNQFLQKELAHIYQAIRNYLGENHILLPIEQVGSFKRSAGEPLHIPVGLRQRAFELDVSSACAADLTETTVILTDMLFEATRSHDYQGFQDVYAVVYRTASRELQASKSIAISVKSMQRENSREPLLRILKTELNRQLDTWAVNNLPLARPGWA